MVCDDVEVNWLACEGARECRLLATTDGSLRTTMLLFDRFSVRELECFVPPMSSSSAGSSSSANATPLNHPKPNWYGLAIGEPLTLSMFSSFRGSRTRVDWSWGRGNFGGLLGSDGLNFGAEGTREVVGCFDGDPGLEGPRGFVEGALNGNLGFAGLGVLPTRLTGRG